MTLDDGTLTWVATRYEDVYRLLTDERFSRAIASAALGPPGPASVMSITEMDPPLHTRIRSLVAEAFSVKAVERLRPRAEHIAGLLLDDLIAAGPPVDLVAAFCAPLTFGVQCELLGVPLADRGEIRASSMVRFGPPGPTQTARKTAEHALYQSVTRVIGEKRRRTSPVDRPGLFDRLIVARDRHDLIDELELRTIATSLFRDGAFLTGIQIANSVRSLLEVRGGLGQLEHAHPTRSSRAIEELLRVHPAVNHSMARVATSNVPLAGTIIHAGQTVTAALPVANRDGTVFADPDRLDLDRPANRHLSLGHGIHYCLGASLSRMEIAVALGALATRLPGLRLTVPNDQLRWFAIQGARGVLNLPVSW